jgi:hypothetical protein
MAAPHGPIGQRIGHAGVVLPIKGAETTETKCLGELVTTEVDHIRAEIGYRALEQHLQGSHAKPHAQSHAQSLAEKLFPRK